MDEIKVYQDASGEYRWKRVAENGNEVADSGEGYTRKASAVEAAEREASGASDAGGIRVVVDGEEEAV